MGVSLFVLPFFLLLSPPIAVPPAAPSRRPQLGAAGYAQIGSIAGERFCACEWLYGPDDGHWPCCLRVAWWLEAAILPAIGYQHNTFLNIILICIIVTPAIVKRGMGITSTDTLDPSRQKK